MHWLNATEIHLSCIQTVSSVGGSNINVASGLWHILAFVP